jgi:cyclic pyranopterin phosphate synthase
VLRFIEYMDVGTTNGWRLEEGAGHDLRGPLRAGSSDQALRGQVAAIWTRRTDRYSELRTRQTSRKKVTRKVEMSHIGG